MKIEKLPLWRSLMYASGNMSSQLTQWAFVAYMSYYYSPPPDKGLKILLPIGLTTVLLGAGRFMEGFLEPIIGYYSDRANTRWGRRMPFIMFGGLPLCVFFALMWFPFFPDNQTLTAIQLVVCSSAFWFCVTIIFCPYLALLPEIARTNEERVTLSQIMQIFMFVGTGVVMLLPALFKPSYGNPQMFVIITIVALISVYMPVFGIQEKRLATREHSDDEAYGILDALKWTFTNKVFVIYVLSTLFMLLGFQTIMNTFIYIVTVLLKKPESFVAVVFGVIIVSILISFILIQYLTRIYSKKLLMSISYLALALALPLIYLLDRPTVLGLPTFYVACVMFFLLGAPVAGITCLGLPMLADIADYDEKLTGRRREAMYFGAQGILQKFTIGLTYLIQGYLFKNYGYSVAEPLGVKLLGPVNAVFVFLGLLVFLMYPLDEKTLEVKKIRMPWDRARGVKPF